jgi:hypothetical protein
MVRGMGTVALRSLSAAYSAAAIKFGALAIGVAGAAIGIVELMSPQPAAVPDRERSQGAAFAFMTQRPIADTSGRTANQLVGYGFEAVNRAVKTDRLKPPMHEQLAAVLPAAPESREPQKLTDRVAMEAPSAGEVTDSIPAKQSANLPPLQQPNDIAAVQDPAPKDLPPRRKPEKVVFVGHTSADHHGGDIEEFDARYQKIRKSGARVVIDGLCLSACTIVASLPKSQVCVTSKASLGVHLATSGNDRGEYIDYEYTKWAVKKYYPQPMQDWINSHGGLEEEPKYIKGKDLLAIFDPCKEDV